MADDRQDTPAPLVNEDPAIDSLEGRIAAARKAEDHRTGKDRPVVDGRNRGMQITSTMVGYPLGGIVVGFVLDRVFDTAPWIMLGLMFAAFAGACLHVVQMNKDSAK